MGLKLKFKLPSKLTAVFKFDNTRSNFRHSGFMVFCLFFLASTDAFSAQARITDLVLRNSQSEVLVDFTVEDFFTDELQAAVLKGIPISISFSISFYEVLDFWFDHKLIQKEEFQRIHYDALRKEYTVKRSWGKRGPLVENDLLQAQKFLSEINGLDIISLSRLKKGAHYQLRIKSELQDRSYLFSGTPWEFETDWYTINFIY